MPPRQLVRRGNPGLYNSAMRAAAYGARNYGPHLAGVAARYARANAGRAASTISRWWKKRSRGKTYKTTRRPLRRLAGGLLPPGQRSIRTSNSRPNVGRRAQGVLNLKQITDMMFPLLRETYDAAFDEIDWSPNQQGIGSVGYLNNAKLNSMFVKANSSDVSNINTGGVTSTGLSGNNQWSTLMKYTGGYVEYKLVNSCNHTITVHAYTFRPKTRCSMTAYDCWAKDLLDDDTKANAVTPINVEALTYTYGSNIIQPNNPHSYLKMFYRLVQSKKYTLGVGEQLTYRIKVPAFTYDNGREQMYENLNPDSDKFLYGPQYRSTVFVCRSQMVVDSTGTKVAHGSGKVAWTEYFQHYTRSGVLQKKYQTVNHGGLDTLAENDQFHYNIEDETLDVATES